jgi:hypothetical protein
MEQFFDKNGTLVKEDDVVFNGKDYYRMHYDYDKAHQYILSCTKGYIDNLTQGTFKDFVVIGSFEDHQDKFGCD